MWLLYKSNCRTGESHVLRKTLCNVTGLKNEDTISKYTNKFKELELLDKYSIKGYNEEAGRISTSITYTINIPTMNWVRFDASLLTEEIPNKLKAFLVLLKCLCLNNTNATFYSKNKIAQLLNMDRGTVSKYMEMAIKEGKVIEINKVFFITDTNIIMDLPHVKDSFTFLDGIAREKYKIIHDYCVERNVVPPPYDYKLMEILYLYRYNRPEPDLETAISNETEANYYSLKYNLSKLCANLPKQVYSLQYFLTSLINRKIYKERFAQEEVKEKVELYL
ncbi:hypothetical protein GGR15_000669 [Butyricimonas paravirosa]|uniref:Uncharacterized protein n=2 Tax=Butyricimonas paravirosa TaxID=1472417 RepID=A0A7X5YAA8_9BACT|nr:hypothetical protein [Butyricimonas paravirosa]